MASDSRLFFALRPDSSLQQQLHTYAKSVRCAANRRIIAAEKIHMTLRFLGSVTDEIKNCLLMLPESDKYQAFTLDLNKAEYWKRQKLLVISSDIMPVPLQNLVQHIEAHCITCGILAEERMFKPHLTLIRNTRDLAEITDPGHFYWHIDQFILMESTTTMNVTTYHPLKRWTLV